MGERHLYRGINDYQGSIDESGNLYDERHNLVGRIEGNDVYDFCNIKQGTVDDAGRLWDASHGYVGTSYGDNFIGPTYRDTGMVRGDFIGDGAGKAGNIVTAAATGLVAARDILEKEGKNGK